MKKIACIFCVAALVAALGSKTGLSESIQPPEEETASAPTAQATPGPTTATSIVQPEASLYIDSETLYEGMNKPYADGYVPSIENDSVRVILPLKGETLNGEVRLSVDLGATEGSPFVYGNYSQSMQLSNETGAYLFDLTIPLNKNRSNGTYPIVFHAAYIDQNGASAEQSFSVYVTITDGVPDQTEAQTINAIGGGGGSGKETVRKPELFISSCSIQPGRVEENCEFQVEMTIDNIGNLQAKNIKLGYASESGMIQPVEQNNMQLLENLDKGQSTSVAFRMRTSQDVLAGDQPFQVSLAYVDAYGGEYTVARNFSVQVVRQAELGYDTPDLGKSVVAGETISLPANVFNMGKSTLRNVLVSLEGPGLFPSSSVFLGDIPPGEAKYGEMQVFVGMLSDADGKGYYGATTAQYIITYMDDSGVEQSMNLELKTLIKEPEPTPTPTIDPKQAEKTQAAGQWWISALIAFAILTIIISILVTSRFIRAFRIGKHSDES